MGRKQNNIPPSNVNRDRQHALHTRRTEYIEYLEQRVKELEEENIRSRQEFAPPAHRLSLSEKPAALSNVCQTVYRRPLSPLGIVRSTSLAINLVPTAPFRSEGALLGENATYASEVPSMLSLFSSSCPSVRKKAERQYTIHAYPFQTWSNLRTIDSVHRPHDDHSYSVDLPVSSSSLDGSRTICPDALDEHYLYLPQSSLESDVLSTPSLLSYPCLSAREKEERQYTTCAYPFQTWNNLRATDSAHGPHEDHSYSVDLPESLSFPDGSHFIWPDVLDEHCDLYLPQSSLRGELVPSQKIPHTLAGTLSAVPSPHENSLFNLPSVRMADRLTRKTALSPFTNFGDSSFFSASGPD
ncbi:hypothetical protein ARMGADRAFT_1079005 [Armillaria gallica]|uniref:BZIP domain-containing protein n=1 Tax=Armillaria gallica TaxID=47427 RepID=A0A2H3DKD2_ARMGA|nr:hypothetical protein ARMGADRAFT_1079005 [Armillaria gallica]